MSFNNLCQGCLSRRQCLKLFSSTALSGSLLGPVLSAQTGFEPGRVDATGLRPDPKVEVSIALLRQPPPYWLGWPGRTYDVEKRGKEYMGKALDSCSRLGIQANVERAPIQDGKGFSNTCKG